MLHLGSGPGGGPPPGQEDGQRHDGDEECSHDPRCRRPRAPRNEGVERLSPTARLFITVRTHIDPSLFMLLGVEPLFLPWTLTLALVVLGAVLGACAALFSLRKLLVV